MIKTLLSVAVLSVVTVAGAQAADCSANPDLDTKVFALWITDNANPDAVPCAGRLSPVSCSVVGDKESRSYASSDGSYAVSLINSPISGNVDSGVTVMLKLSNAAGVGRGHVTLATFRYQVVVFHGIGDDNVHVFDQSSSETKSIGNVMLIPVDALTDNGLAQCPAN